MKSLFRKHIKKLLVMQHLYLWQVAQMLEMDTAQGIKIEKGVRQFKREHISVLADILKASSDELMTLWLADQLYEVVRDAAVGEILLTYRRKIISS